MAEWLVVFFLFVAFYFPEYWNPSIQTHTLVILHHMQYVQTNPLSFQRAICQKNSHPRAYNVVYVNLSRNGWWMEMGCVYTEGKWAATEAPCDNKYCRVMRWSIGMLPSRWWWRIVGFSGIWDVALLNLVTPRPSICVTTELWCGVKWRRGRLDGGVVLLCWSQAAYQFFFFVCVYTAWTLVGLLLVDNNTYNTCTYVHTLEP